MCKQLAVTSVPSASEHMVPQLPRLRSTILSIALLGTLSACTTPVFNPVWRAGWVEQVAAAETMASQASATSPCWTPANVSASSQAAVVAVAHLRAKHRVIMPMDARLQVDAGQKVLVNVGTCQMMAAR